MSQEQQQQQDAATQQQQQQAMTQMNNAGQVFHLNPAALASMLQQQQLPQQQQQQQVDLNNDSNNSKDLNISNEIKRLQQFHQMSAGGPLLVPATDHASLLQNMIDQQNKQQRFDTPLAQTVAGVNMLQPAFFQAQLPGAIAMADNNNPVSVPLPSPHSLFHRDGSRRMRGGVIEPFPEKLHRLLTEVEAAGRSDVISFVSNGQAFCIHKPDKFFKEIVPLYFRQSRLSSFKRQLNLYGFELINTGPARGGYYHELFVKDRPELCRRMRRVAVKVSSKNFPEDSKEETKEDDNAEESGEQHQQKQQEEV